MLLVHAAKRVRWQWLAPFLICAISIGHDARLLWQYPVAVGLDGYYYVLQIDQLREQGSFFFPTLTPLVLYGLTGLSYLLGNTVLSIKVGSLIMHTLLCTGVLLLLKSVTRSFWLGVLGSLITAFSPLHLFMVAEFLKHLGALTFLVWGAWCAHRALETRSSKWTIASLTLLVVALLSHKSTIGILIVLAILVMLFIGTSRPGLKMRYRYAALFLLLLIFVVPGIVAIQPYFEVPAWLRLELSPYPRWPLSGITVHEGFILVFVAPVTLFLLATSRVKPLDHRTLTLAAVALWSLIITVSPFLNSDPGLRTISGRLGYLAYIQVAILFPGVLWLISRWRRGTAIYAAAVLLPLVALSMRTPLPHGLRPHYLDRRAQLIQSLPTTAGSLGQAPVVIAAHGDQFLITATLGIRSQQRLPDTDYDPVFWLFDQFECQKVPDAIVVIRESGGLCTVLVKDPEVRQLLAGMAETEQRRLFRANPYFRLAHQSSTNH